MLVVLLAAPLMAQQAPKSAEQRGWQVLETALQAAGGRAKLAAVKDMSFELQSHVVTPQGAFDFPSRTRFVFPDTVRQDMKLPVGELNIAFNQSGGWRRGPQGTVHMPAAELKRAQEQLVRVNILFRPPEDRRAVRWIETATLEGRMCDVIELPGPNAEPLRLFVDRGTGDVIKRSYHTAAPEVGLAGVEEFLSDFREVDGLRLSFKVREMRNGQLARESVTKDMKINSGLKAEELLH